MGNEEIFEFWETENEYLWESTGFVVVVVGKPRMNTHIYIFSLLSTQFFFFFLNRFSIHLIPFGAFHSSSSPIDSFHNFFSIYFFNSQDPLE